MKMFLCELPWGELVLRDFPDGQDGCEVNVDPSFAARVLAAEVEFNLVMKELSDIYVNPSHPARRTS